MSQEGRERHPDVAAHTVHLYAGNTHRVSDFNKQFQQLLGCPYFGGKNARLAIKYGDTEYNLIKINAFSISNVIT
jgi:hypothetical protein